MTKHAGGRAIVAEVVEIPERREVLIRVDNPQGNVTLAVDELKQRFKWDGTIEFAFDDEGNEWWAMKGVEGLDEYPLQPEAPELLGDRLVS